MACLGLVCRKLVIEVVFLKDASHIESCIQLHDDRMYVLINILLSEVISSTVTIYILTKD